MGGVKEWREGGENVGVEDRFIWVRVRDSRRVIG